MCGSVIHATGNKILEKWGVYIILCLYLCYYAYASLSLVGFPFLSGFYSKDLLLESIFIIFKDYSFPIFLISALSTFISSFYSFRLIYFVFFSEMKYGKKIKESLSSGGESSFLLYIPLIILSIFSIFSGYFLKDLFFMFPFYSNVFEDSIFDLEFFNDFYKFLPSLFSFLGILSVILSYTIYKKEAHFFYKKYILFSFLFCKKFFFDSFNSLFLAFPFSKFSLNYSYKFFDKGFF